MNCNDGGGRGEVVVMKVKVVPRSDLRNHAQESGATGAIIATYSTEVAVIPVFGVECASDMKLIGYPD